VFVDISGFQHDAHGPKQFERMRPFKAPGSQIKLSEDDPEKYSSTAVRKRQRELETETNVHGTDIPHASTTHTGRSSSSG
jgi:hypothetical protein